ncbi:unnamed protein product [Anisakis simplex]|uniref:FIT family protein (inferred by orthology to a C. elegans protein) n=1 Tax=Anisakis simplex TaxID=6269 RepID=A0A0M3JTD7_ANISI|nr:unnamed protein product [Anisakis simplex]
MFARQVHVKSHVHEFAYIWERSRLNESEMAHQSVLNEVLDIIGGIVVQIARKYLLIKPEKKSVFYLIVVFILSIFAVYVPLSNEYYFVQKDNILNKYGVKLGWFWTCVIVGPFVWYTSRAHGKNAQEAVMDLSRIVVATALWYFCTNSFVTFERMTGYCHGAKSSSRSTCYSNGGKWMPGIDISGHCFLLIYSILIMCEEDFELIISILHYHHVFHKVTGALIAVSCWFVTYRFWFPITQFPPMPFHQRITSTR